jgi:protein TonB
MKALQTFLSVVLFILVISVTAQETRVVKKDSLKKDEGVSFRIIDKVPTFRECKGDRTALKLCFNQKMYENFVRNFNSDLPNELGLEPGIKRMYVLFLINKEGKIENIRAKAPHPRLQEELVRVIKLLPRMVPGEQDGSPVGVKYTFPVSISVE